jgi:hypothetical protein
MVCLILIVGGLLIVMGQHDRSEAQIVDGDPMNWAPKRYEA